MLSSSPHSNVRTVIGHFNEFKTICAAIGSAQKLNSAARTIFPRPKINNRPFLNSHTGIRKVSIAHTVLPL